MPQVPGVEPCGSPAVPPVTVGLNSKVLETAQALQGFAAVGTVGHVLLLSVVVRVWVMFAWQCMLRILIMRPLPATEVELDQMASPVAIFSRSPAVIVAAPARQSLQDVLVPPVGQLVLLAGFGVQPAVAV